MQSKGTIVLATGLFPPDVGGPAKYAEMLYVGLQEKAIPVRLVRWTFEKHLPALLRHGVFFLRLLYASIGARSMLAFDATSVGYPAQLVSKIIGVPLVVRFGGDAIWEAYVNRTKEPLSLSEFYIKERDFTKREKILLTMTRKTLARAQKIVVNTSWYGDILEKAYQVPREKIVLIENSFQQKSNTEPQGVFTLLSSSRTIPLKNMQALETVVATLAQEGSPIDLYTKPFLAEEFPKLMEHIHATAVVSFSEVSPNLVLEGLEYGRPFVVTRDTGLHPRFHGAGVFVDPKDTHAIHAGIQELMKNYATYRQVAKNISYEHTKDNIVQSYLSIL